MTALQRIAAWDGQGNPVVATVPLITKAQVAELYAAAAAETFNCPDPLDPDHEFHGLSMAEVMVRKEVRAAARSGNAETVMDRLVGRPKQTSESTRLTLGYEDALKEIERKERLKLQADGRGGPAAPIVVEATVVRDADGGVLD